MTFYFYDLETSGVNPREQRVMQFAGQRTNEKLEPIGEIDDYLIKLSDDILPDPWAILTHGVSPQKANSEGLSEAEFLDWFHAQVVQPDTIICGYNTIRFDDEFMRYMNYRNFYDPYEWQWRDNRSKWDLLDVVRMTRALRPEGIEWPFASNGNPTVTLESMTTVNNISHSEAHTAGSDVEATIALAKLVRDKQPKLFDYLVSVRSKQAVAKLAQHGVPFVYTSGRYSGDNLATTVVVSIGEHPKQPGSLIVYDLRVDPEDFKGLQAEELAGRMFVKKDSGLKRLPAKLMALNRAPAVAPLGVMDEPSWKRIKLTQQAVEANLKKLNSSDLPLRILEAFKINNKQRQATFLAEESMVEAQLYDGFFNPTDKLKMAKVRNSDKNGLADIQPNFADSRLDALLPLYKARNYPKSLTPEEIEARGKYIHNKFYGGKEPRLAKFVENMQKAAETFANDKQKMYLLEELKLYVENIVPEAE